jgi:hypothetical protein
MPILVESRVTRGGRAYKYPRASERGAENEVACERRSRDLSLQRRRY